MINLATLIFQTLHAYLASMNPVEEKIKCFAGLNSNVLLPTLLETANVLNLAKSNHAEIHGLG